MLSGKVTMEKEAARTRASRISRTTKQKGVGGTEGAKARKDREQEGQGQGDRRWNKQDRREVMVDDGYGGLGDSVHHVSTASEFPGPGVVAPLGLQFMWRLRSLHHSLTQSGEKFCRVQEGDLSSALGDCRSSNEQCAMLQCPG